jgi:hypothetical protein
VKISWRHIVIEIGQYNVLGGNTFEKDTIHRFDKGIQ